MAARKEEIFIEENIQPGSVFDFGCGDARLTRRIAKTHPTTAIDLNTPEDTTGFEFIKGDMLDIDVEGKFDNVYSASSLEHAGLGFKECGYCDLYGDKKIAEKLANLTKPGGLLILTLPFGKNELFVHNEKGDIGSFEKVQDPVCGFRTYNITGILSMFDGFSVVKSTAYLKETGRADFSNENPDSWTEMSIIDYDKIKPNQASLCIVLRKHGDRRK
jgi:SAM-dependent methyltransferase